MEKFLYPFMHSNFWVGEKKWVFVFTVEVVGKQKLIMSSQNRNAVNERCLHAKHVIAVKGINL
jgi:hypothetical protein